MKKAQILHNPGAGKATHSKEQLIMLVESHGYKCGYSSTKDKGWKKLKSDVDFLIIAGGDGTVRRAAVKIFDKSKAKNIPIALLPLGTANNIAKSLGITSSVNHLLSTLNRKNIKKYDVGRVEGLPSPMLFVESFGYGIFQELMRRIKKMKDRKVKNPEEEIKAAQELLKNIILEYAAETFQIIIDDRIYTGNYILVEVMNISSIGPNLNLSPNADPGDGIFELILVAEDQRAEFALYAAGKVNGLEKKFKPLIIQGKKITIITPSTRFHIDDELFTLTAPATVTLKPERGMMEFLMQ